MGRERVIGIDIGTGSIRVALLDLDGQLVALASRQQQMEVPRPGWAEQDAERWWAATVEGLREVLARSGTAPADIVAIGADAQMHAAIPIDSDGRVLTDGVPLWCDKRASPLARRAESHPDAQRIMRLAADPPLAAWVGFKMAWFRDFAPELYAASSKFLTGAAFVNYRLTGETAMDWSEASGVFLLDAATLRWSQELASFVGVSLDKLPQVVESTTVVGAVTRSASSLTGLAEGTPVIAGAGDMPCMLLAAGMSGEGTAVDITGTASDFCVFSRDPILDPPTMNLHHAVPGWIPFGIAEAGGGSLKWFNDRFGVAVDGDGTDAGDGYQVLERDVAAAEHGAGGLIFLPYLMGERLLGSPLSRGAFIGMTPRTGRAEMARAVMEGVCFELRRTLDIAERAGAHVETVYTTGGGARSPAWSQIKADIYERPVRTVTASEGGVLGAALLAAVGVGALPTVAEGVKRWVVPDQTFSPDPDRFKRYRALFEVFQDVHDRLQEPFEKLAVLP